MSGRTIPLGRILGIPVGVDLTWFAVFALVTGTLALRYYQPLFSEWSAVDYWGAGALTALLFFLSVLLHEIGHSLVARLYGIPVLRVTLMMFGGVAEVGISKPNPNAEFWVALAGPATNLVLAGLFTLIGDRAASVGVVMAAEYLTHVNLILAAYNLIPGLPLDGGRVLRAIIWGSTRDLRRATQVASLAGQIAAYVSIAAGVYLIVTGSLTGGLWMAFTGWILQTSAASMAQRRTIQDLLQGRNVGEAMCCTCTGVAPLTSLQEVMDGYLSSGGPRCFTVVEEGRLAGLLTIHRINQVPRGEWPNIRANQAMIPAEEVKRVAPDTGLWDALGKMDREGVNQLPVTVNEQLVGMLSREDVLSYLQTLGQMAI